MSGNYSSYPRDNRSRGHKSDHRGHAYHQRGHEYHQNRHHRREPSGIRKEKQFKHSSGLRHVPATKNRYLSREDISRLAESTSSVVSNYVNKNTFGFLAAFNYKRFYEDNEILTHLVKILHLLTRIDDFERVAPRTIARIFDRNGEYSDFICSLNKHIKMMGIEKRLPFLQRNLKSLQKLADIGIKMLSSLPDTSVSTFPVLSIKEAVDDISKKTTTVPDGIMDDVKRMVDLYYQTHSEKDVRHVCAGSSYQYIDDMHILPPLEGLVASSSLNIQANIIEGPYRSWKHYLDTQYQLMRGDFLIPLREGINNLSHHVGNQKKNESLYVYSQVKIREPVFLYAGVGFQLHFDVSKLKSINWENSKRLMFGSLLCLSKDNFQSSVLYASVMKRDPRILNDGFVTVKFEEDISHLQLCAEDTFTMVESMAYFEAYKHVLSKLKESSAHVDTLPFKKYIVNCDLHDILPPSYALQQTKLKFDLSSVLNCSANVVLTEPTSWPHFSDTCLDESQLRALKSALTKEVSIIQGPPGTGKTYIGLKILEAYLQNRSVWDCNKESPMLVICYTNHALDQFLEGIQKLKIDGNSPSIIRIGGRCKSIKLSKCVLKNKVDDFQEAQRMSRSLLRDRTEAYIGMTETRNDIDRQVLSSKSDEGSLKSLSQLKHVMLERHFNSFKTIKCREERKLWHWLHLSPSLNYTKTKSNAIHNKSSKAYIEIDDVKCQEDSRITEGEEIVFNQNSCASEIPSYDSYQVSETKKRKVEKKRKDVCKAMTIEEMSQIKDIFDLSKEKKWQLYHYWEKQLLLTGLTTLKDVMSTYEEWCRKYQRTQKEIEKGVLFRADVIGMTTTGAAKHHHLLQKIHPKIVVFEEAAEIFESHIITSLPLSVQQLILIGDHQQLRPKPNCYDLEIKYNLGISLFERLVSNGIQYETLEIQHRMRPEVSSLIHPSIYPVLKDHDSVNKYESVRGIAENVFLVTHSEHEEIFNENDSKTHVNKFEADYIVALCHYLLKQGYEPSQITILTMYRGQLFAFKTRMVRETFNGVRVTVVDDYQGEENDIILLSLVRSNPDEKIGFLQESNRICVSLSRAKKGLYIIGNADMFRNKEETIWPKIINVLKQKKCVQNGLPLYCSVHTDTRVAAKTPEDFLKSPEGGCEKKCGVRLSCGHACPKMCHPKDMNHTEYKCTKKCARALPCKHKCKEMCYTCIDGCPPCLVKVEKVVPTCGHKVTMRCCDDPKNVRCTQPCMKKLSCAHSAQGICSEVTNCTEPCEAVLDCGDKCTGTCGECHMGRLHKRCNRSCGRQLFCGHTCDFPCASSCPPCLKSCRNFCIHSRCPKKCFEPCMPCMESCDWQCKHLKCTKRCGEVCDRPPCNEPCMKTKKCGHPCIGLCGEKCPTLCRTCNKDEVCEIFFGTEDEDDARFIQLEDCGHVLEVSGLDKYILESESQSGDKTFIKFSDCPKCRTPIRTSLRYCNKVKQVLADVEELKKREIELPPNLKEKFEALKALPCRDDFLKVEIKDLGSEVENYRKLLPGKVNALLVQISIFDVIVRILNIYSTIPTHITTKWQKQFPLNSARRMKKYLKVLKNFVSQYYLSKQQISDCTCEARRLLCAAKLFQLICKLSDPNPLSIQHQDKVEAYMETIFESGWKRKKLEENEQNDISDFVREIETVYELGLSEKERIDIVKAIGLKKGHWYKCPKGHYYCIGECGGAMEEAKCPECGDVIGGQRHQLAGGNLHAPEMDGSSFAAWSERANLENFDLRDLH